MMRCSVDGRISVFMLLGFALTATACIDHATIENNKCPRLFGYDCCDLLS